MIGGMNEQTSVALIAGERALMAQLNKLRKEEYVLPTNVRRVVISQQLWENIGFPVLLNGFAITPNPELEPTQLMVVRKRDLPREAFEQ